MCIYVYMYMYVRRSKKCKLPLELHGEGCVGKITCDSVCVDFGTVVIGTSSSRKLVLTNPSLCNLQYQLFTEQTLKEEGRVTAIKMDTSHGMYVYMYVHICVCVCMYGSVNITSIMAIKSINSQAGVHCISRTILISLSIHMYLCAKRSYTDSLHSINILTYGM